MTIPDANRRNLLWASTGLFLVHLPLLFLACGEFTDGVLQAAYFDDPPYVIGEGVGPARYVPPLYPFAIRSFSILGIDPILAGRLLSAVAYAACAFVLGTLGSALSRNKNAGWLVWAFWALSPMANRWSFHCMTDMAFCFFSTLSLALLIAANVGGMRHSASRCWMAGNIVGVLAAWTRFQGLALVGGAILSLCLIGRDRRPSLRSIGLAVAIWGGTVVLLQTGFGVHQGQFSDRAVYPAGVYLDFASSAFQYLPYAVTPPLLFLAFFGLYRTAVSSRKGAYWVGLGLVGALSGLAVQTFFLSFQFRYGLPLLPWICLLAGVGLNEIRSAPLRRGLLGLTVVWMAILSGAVIGFQHETFADIERASKKVPDFLGNDQTVWGHEDYNWLEQGKNIRYGNVKMSVGAGIPVQWLDADSLDQVQVGDLFIDSNVYPSSDPSLRKAIRERWKLKALYEEVSETRPLFPGEVLWFPFETPSGTIQRRGTSDPHLMKFRFASQIYTTVIYRLETER